MRDWIWDEHCPIWISSVALLACLLVAPVQAQPSLQITSPASGTVVNPGQSLTIIVAASGTFQEVAIIGPDPIGISQPITSPPYQFTVPIPASIDAGVYLLTADGFTASGQSSSNSINIVVEHADPPASIKAEPSVLQLSVGQNGYLSVTGVFTDGTTPELTRSTLISFASDTPTVATVQAQGIVTAVAQGLATITVAYGSLTFPVSVTVPQPVTIAPPSTALYAAQTQQFFAQTSAISTPSIAWSLSPADVGSIDSTGLYTAPSLISTQQAITITATNTADNTQFATASLTLFPPVSLSVVPNSIRHDQLPEPTVHRFDSKFVEYRRVLVHLAE